MGKGVLHVCCGGWGDRDVSYSPNDPLMVFLFTPGEGGAPPPASFRSSGVLGGVQAGYNWQFNPSWLVGIETDFDWSNVKGSASSVGVIETVAPYTATATSGSNGSARRGHVWVIFPCPMCWLM